MNTKGFFAVIIILIVIIGGGYYFLNRGDNEDAEVFTNSNENESGGATSTSAMYAEDNAVIVVEQRPGNTITASQILLADAGFLVIHEDDNGKPGEVLGVSSLLRSGETANVKVTLSRSSRDGEKLHAMLHRDSDGNEIFGIATDTPVQSRLGGPLGGWFDISSSSPAGGQPITI